jgi:CheY-like chemotaxis protein
MESKLTKILLVDDNEDTREMLHLLLQGYLIIGLLIRNGPLGRHEAAARLYSRQQSGCGGSA